MMFNSCRIIIVLSFLVFLGKCEFGHKEHSDVMRGYLLGLTVKQTDLDSLIACFYDDRTGRANFVELMSKIDRLDYTNLPLVAKFFTDLLTSLRRGIISIDLCTQENHNYDRLFKRIYNTMATTLNKRLMLNFISNPQQIAKDIEDAVDNYQAGKFKELGKDIGDIMHILLTFSVESPSFELDDCLEALKGFFAGLKIDEKFVSNCFDKMTAILHKLIMPLQGLNDDIFEVIEALEQLFQQARDIIRNWNACNDFVAELKGVINKILNTKVIEVIIKNYMMILNDVLKTREAFLDREYKSFGQILGNMLHRLFLN